METPLVEVPYISCKNLAEVEHVRHYLQVSYIPDKISLILSDQSFLQNSDNSCKILGREI